MYHGKEEGYQQYLQQTKINKQKKGHPPSLTFFKSYLNQGLRSGF